MPITDLTGTSWRFGEYLYGKSTFSYNVTYDITMNNYVIKNSNSVLSSKYYTDSGGRFYFIPAFTWYDFTGNLIGSSAAWLYQKNQIASEIRNGFEYLDLTFTGGADVTNADLIAWLEANATRMYDEEPESPEELPGGTTITYDGGTIAAVVSGGTATLKCAGLKMKTDITVKAAEGGVNLPTYDGDVEIEGEEIPDSGSGGTAEFNIAYGDTAPTDTSKLWIKANEPEAVSVTSNLVVGSEELITGVAEMKDALYYHSAAAVGTKIYIFGGYYLSNSNTRANAYVFDTITDTRTEITSMPSGLYHMGIAAVGTKIYLLGGRSGTVSQTYIREYDTENDTYTNVASLEQQTHAIATVAVGTKIYLFGGAYGSNNTRRNTIYEFDTEQKTITNIGAKLPKAASDITAAAVGTKIYLFGGDVGSDRLDTINVFDTENYSIATLSVTLPVARASMGSAAVGKKIYLFGGGSDNTIMVFDTESNTIATLDAKLPGALYSICAAAVGTKIFLVGAQNQKTIHAFVTSFPLAANNLLIEASIKENVVNILPNVELGVNNVYLGNADGNGEKVDAYLHNGTEWVEV